MQDMDFDRVAPGELEQQPEHTLISDEFLRLMPLVNRETGPAETASSGPVVFRHLSSVAKTNHEMLGTDSQQPNQVINFCVNGKVFCVLATDKAPDFHFTGDTQCLSLYRYTPDGERLIDLLRRVCTVSVKTMAVVDSMAYWERSAAISL